MSIQSDQIAMKALNLFAINEDDQFEVHQVLKASDQPSRYWAEIVNPVTGSQAEHEGDLFLIAMQKWLKNFIREGMTFSNHLHIFVTKYIIDKQHSAVFNDKTLIQTLIYKMRSYGLKNVTITFVAAEKSHCITKEQFETDYKINVDTDQREDLSIGEDLESLIGRIKSGQICKNANLDSSLDEYKESFNLCLLTPDENAKLKTDKMYINTYSQDDPDIPEAIMNMCDSKKKFSKTYCWRKTYFLRINIFSRNWKCRISWKDRISAKKSR